MSCLPIWWETKGGKVVGREILSDGNRSDPYRRWYVGITYSTITLPQEARFAPLKHKIHLAGHKITIKHPAFSFFLNVLGLL